MEKYTLKASKREDKTPNRIRQEGNVPATIYGPTFEPESIQFCAREFSRLPAAAFSHLLELDFGTGKPLNVIIRNVQRKSTTDSVVNVEFYRVRLDKKLTVTVPIKFVGTATAVTTWGAQLLESAVDVEVECMPNDIPDFIECDLSLLKELDSAINFSDLKVPASVKVLNPLDEVVARAVTPRSTESATPEPAKQEAAAT
ncbi:MAG: 50S ribosomal protein L25 [Candidatus Obscuribacterales bacterium]|nr:50S ribosomal protein L25 [Candidatus Obscuribacterales bacterium]